MSRKIIEGFSLEPHKRFLENRTEEIINLFCSAHDIIENNDLSMSIGIEKGNFLTTNPFTDRTINKREFQEYLGRIIKRKGEENNPYLANYSAEDYTKHIRGIVYLLLFATYEKLLHDINISLLENIFTLRCHPNRLTRRSHRFILSNNISTISNLNESYTGKKKRVASKKKEKLNIGYADEIFNIVLGKTAIYKLKNRKKMIQNNFPDDGSYMKQSQIEHWWHVWDLSDDNEHPGKYLSDIWNDINSVVKIRNDIAHGNDMPARTVDFKTPADVMYDILAWKYSWLSFIDYVESRAKYKEFYMK